MINIIGTIYDNSSLHTVALANQVKDEEYKDGTKKQSQINQEFDERINAISAYHKNNKGLYNSPESLREYQPEPEVGDWAIVVEDNNLIIWACSTAGQWRSTEREYLLELPDLEEYVTDIELSSILNNYATKQDLDQDKNDVKHIFTTLEEYLTLESQQENTIYFITEPNKMWEFGSIFPITFTEKLGTF